MAAVVSDTMPATLPVSSSRFVSLKLKLSYTITACGFRANRLSCTYITISEIGPELRRAIGGEVRGS